MYPDSVDRQAQDHLMSLAGFSLPSLTLEEGVGGIGDDHQFPWNMQPHFPEHDISYNQTNTTTSEWNSNNFMTSGPVEPAQLNNWITLNEENPSALSNALSLSLASHFISDNRLSLPSNKTHSQNASSSTITSNHPSFSFGSSSNHKPVVSESAFLHAMQDMLSDIASCAFQNSDQIGYCADGAYNLDGAESQRIIMQNSDFLRPKEKKKRLLSLLQLVDDQYNQCLDQVHTVISAFHAVSKMDPYLHARFALPTITFMYKKLRDKISNYILAMGDENSFETRFLQKQWDIQQQLRKKSIADPHIWRPSRGLPETSVSVLRAWMFQNFLRPYPKEGEKQLLALKSGLTRGQVSNWFINARVRIWKPMIEEMYAENNRRKDHHANTNSMPQICLGNIPRLGVDSHS